MVETKTAGAGQEDDAMGRKRYPPDTVDALRAALAQAERPPRTMSARQVVAALADDLRAMLVQGWSIDQLVDLLARNEIDLMPTTLQGYLRQPKSAKAAKPRSRFKTKPKAKRAVERMPEMGATPTAPQASLSLGPADVLDEDIDVFLDQLQPD